MSAEYRLVVDKGYVVKTYPKRDEAHALLGVEHAYRDFGRYGSDGRLHLTAWIETRTVTEWEKTT